MIVLYPIVLAGALYLAWKSAQRGLGARGWMWFGAWLVAGALFTFSLLTGFSIGLYVFPAAAFAMFWLAGHAPHLREIAGFPLGAILVVLGVLLLI
jgi:hypothetical protein